MEIRRTTHLTETRNKARRRIPPLETGCLKRWREKLGQGLSYHPNIQRRLESPILAIDLHANQYLEQLPGRPVEDFVPLLAM